MTPDMQQQINDQYSLAAQQQQQMNSEYGVAPQQPMVDQYGQPISQQQQSPYGVLDASQQTVPVYQGQKPKKPFIDKGELCLILLFDTQAPTSVDFLQVVTF